jgi:hypothetical protein
MQDVKDALDVMERAPAPEARGDWEAVLRDAGARRRRRFMRPLAGLAAAATALFALALFQPWDSETPTVLERALAAVGDGPVLHVVLRGEWGGTLVDLDTGKRQPVHGESEIWYDTERGLVHSRSLLGGVVQDEEVYRPKEPPAELVALGTEYRQALEEGSARIAGQGVVEGQPVYWITSRSEMFPDSADGKLHELAHQVAISRETFEPVATRETRDGEPGPLGTRQRVLLLETLRAGEGDFTATEANSLEGTMFKGSREPIALEQAEEALGRTPLWLGREHSGLPLAEVFRKATAIGRHERIRLTGELARKAEKCTELKGLDGGRCVRALGYRGSLEIRSDGVYTHGPTVWEEEQTGVVLFYGALGDEPSTFRKELVPRYEAAHVAVTQTTRRVQPERGAGKYVPAEGSLFLAAGGMGFLRIGGLHIAIEASSEELILSAARALEPMPG